VLILAVGSYTLWVQGWAMWIWVPVAACWGIALLLLRWWRTPWRLIGKPQVDVLPRWTPRDAEAWSLVDTQAGTVEQAAPDQLLRPQFYFDTAMSLSQEIARIYHPKADDPVANLTLPEILAAVELAAEDLAQMANRYLPAGHLLTVKHWRRIAAFPGWYQRFSMIYWPISAVFAPATVIARYATSKMIVSPVTQVVQDNLLSWFYVCFVHRLGYYLIELNSGRLAGGAGRFRELMRQMNEGFDATGMPTLHRPANGAHPTAQAATQPATEHQQPGKPASQSPGDAAQDAHAVEAMPTAPIASAKGSSATATQATAAQRPGTSGLGPDGAAKGGAEIVICLIGQSKAGKSSLINALLGEQEAVVDVIPHTSTIRRHVVQRRETHDTLVLLDTVGYAVDGFTGSQKADLQEALRQSDLVLLVMNTTNPARDPDVHTLDQLYGWFQQRRDLKPIPILGVLTHVDLLRPPRQWEPPYDWQAGVRSKERSIRDAVAYHRELLGPRAAGVVPVCADIPRERVFGVEEFLVPAMTPLLGEARASSLLRTLHHEISQGRAGRVVQQFWEIGKRLVRAGAGDRSPLK
jgi:predicted GTPase